MEKPVVMTYVGSLPEVVFRMRVLVEPRSSDAIAEGVEKIYKGGVDDKGKRIFRWDECVEKYIKVYKEVLKK